MLLMPRCAWAQTAERRYRLGWLGTVNILNEPYSQAFVQRLGELGFLDGKNLSITFRHAAGRVDALPGFAAELVKLNCDVFFGAGPEASLVALKQATRNTPIVFLAVDFDPVAIGLVAGLARPGGLVTGITAVQSILPGKRLELLKELIPHARKVGVFTNEQTAGQLAVAQDAARRLGYHTVRLDAGEEQQHSRVLFADSGYREIPPYNANHIAVYFGEKDLSGW